MRKGLHLWYALKYYRRECIFPHETNTYLMTRVRSYYTEGPGPELGGAIIVYCNNSLCQYFILSFKFFARLQEIVSYEYNCGNGRCIDDSLSCNGYKSCGDGNSCHWLSSGAVAGIVIGALAGMALVVTLIVVLCCCRRRRKLPTTMVSMCMMWKLTWIKPNYKTHATILVTLTITLTSLLWFVSISPFCSGKVYQSIKNILIPSVRWCMSSGI